MKIKKYKLVAWATLILSFILLASYFNMNKSDSKSLEKINSQPDEERWKIYSNKQYGFEIKFPSTWHLYEDFTTSNPVVNIYPQTFGEHPPFNHFSNSPHVSVYPNGLAMDGVVGDRLLINDGEEFFPYVTTSKLTEFKTKDGSTWAITTQFLGIPNQWSEWGYLWARMEVKNFEEICVRNGNEISKDECNIFEGDQITRSGEVDDVSEQLIRSMLNSFKFIQ